MQPGYTKGPPTEGRLVECLCIDEVAFRKAPTWKCNRPGKIDIVQALHIEQPFHLVDQRPVTGVENAIDVLDDAVDTAHAILRSELLDRSVPIDRVRGVRIAMGEDSA